MIMEWADSGLPFRRPPPAARRSGPPPYQWDIRQQTGLRSRRLRVTPPKNHSRNRL